MCIYSIHHGGPFGSLHHRLERIEVVRTSIMPLPSQPVSARYVLSSARLPAIHDPGPHIYVY